MMTINCGQRDTEMLESERKKVGDKQRKNRNVQAGRMEGTVEERLRVGSQSVLRTTFAGSLVSEIVLSAAAASVWGSLTCVTEKLP